MIKHLIPEKTQNRIKNYSISQYPKEACGFILNKENDFEFVPCQNMHPEPEGNFQIDPNLYCELEEKIAFVFHSHTGIDNFSPSKIDHESQLSFAVPWALLACDATKTTDLEIFGWNVFYKNLIGLNFKYGIRDCYSLIRSFYFNGFERDGIKIQKMLKQVPTNDRWWEDASENIYINNFKDVGFQEIPLDINKLKIGDMILMRIGRTKCINHAALYVGNGWILHHLYGQLSSKESINNYVNRIEKVVRYDDKSESQGDLWNDSSRAIVI